MMMFCTRRQISRLLTAVTVLVYTHPLVTAEPRPLPASTRPPRRWSLLLVAADLQLLLDASSAISFPTHTTQPLAATCATEILAHVTTG